MEDKKINNNEHPYVNLDLPSGTLWATCNVGASKPTDYGLYFQWGDTQGYTIEQVGKDKQFNWNNYKWSIYGSESNFNKYANDGDTLGLEDDSTNANMGGDWHMPSPKQVEELLGNTTSIWLESDGINGRLFISKKGSSKSIFIPAAGYACNGEVWNREMEGNIWTSMLSNYGANYVQYLYLCSRTAFINHLYNRYVGFSVRGVIG